MARYRLYNRNLNGSITSFEDFEAEDDAAGLIHAKILHQGDSSELWHEDRRIATLMPFSLDGSKRGELVVLMAEDDAVPAE